MLTLMHQMPWTPALRAGISMRCCLHAGLAVSAICGIAAGAALAGAAAVTVAWVLLVRRHRRQQPSAATLFSPCPESKDRVSALGSATCLIWTAWHSIWCGDGLMLLLTYLAARGGTHAFSARPNQAQCFTFPCSINKDNFLCNDAACGRIHAHTHMIEEAV